MNDAEPNDEFSLEVVDPRSIEQIELDDRTTYPRPYGFWTRRHIAAHPKVKLEYSSFMTGLRQEDWPPLEHTLRMGGMYLYSDAAVEQWVEQLVHWRATRKERGRAKKAQLEAEKRMEQDRAAERWDAIRVQALAEREALAQLEAQRAAMIKDMKW